MKDSEVKYYDLSAAQRRLWLLSHFEGGENAYNVPLVVMLQGTLSLPAFERAYVDMVGRHEILRTVFREDEKGQPRQRVLATSEYAIKLSYIDICGDNSLLDSLVAAEIAHTFDLTQPLIKCHLIKLATDSYVMVLVLHHIVTDEWSMDVFAREFSSMYNGYVSGQEVQLPLLRIQYKDYAAWHNSRISGDGIAVHRQYWMEQFAGDIPVLQLAADHPRPATKTYNGAEVSGEVPVTVVNGFNVQSRGFGGTLFMHVLACVNALLYRYTGQEDIVLGSPSAGREHPELERQLGYYINTLALRTRFAGDQSYEELYGRVIDVALGAYEHQLFQFDDLVSALQTTRDNSRNPLFDVMVVLQEAGSGTGLALTGIDASIMETATYDVAKFDLTFNFLPTETGMSVLLGYNTDLYSSASAAAMLQHLMQIMLYVSANPKARLCDIKMLSDDEAHYLVNSLNDTRTDCSGDKTIVDLFEEQARKTPDSIAVVFEDRQVNYAELNALSNRLAAYLRHNYEVKPDELIGVNLGKSEWMIVAILGILKSGAAYVPIDPEYPKDRIDLMVNDSGCRVLINDVAMEAFKAGKDDYDAIDQPAGLRSDNLAYCIYTSGSTGTPKGVLIEHRSVVNLLMSKYSNRNKALYDFRSTDTWTMFHSHCFDVSVWEMFGALLFGGKLVVVPQSITRDADAFIALLEKESVSVLCQTPSAFYNLMEVDRSDTALKLRYVIFAGEALLPARLLAWKSMHPQISLVNMYGITETTVHVTYREMDLQEISKNISDIGKPIPGLTCYILDPCCNLVPVGVPGELYVGGAGLARGYLNRHELTGERFIDNPYKPGERIYRSGDLARWLPDGNLEYLGRIDEQVKIRGYRVETGEIEAVLQRHAQVSGAVVVAMPLRSSEKELIAYTVGAATAETLRNYLRTWLPVYMVPGLYVSLHSIPLTSNGKVDKRALPLPEGAGLSANTYIAPKTDAELKLVQIWSEVLKMPAEEISVEANFFDLGGHSLLVTQAVLRMNKRFGAKISMRHFFEKPTVGHLATSIDEGPFNGGANMKDHSLYADSLLPEYIRPVAGASITIVHERILLTGATGFLGAHLLSDMLCKTQATIYCLVRSQDAQRGLERIMSNMEKYGLEPVTDHHRVVAVVGDLSLPQLGVADSEYDFLAHNIDSIFHNGANVHHIYNYEVLRNSNVGSTLEVLKLATTKKVKYVYYVSTLSDGVNGGNSTVIIESFVGPEQPGPLVGGYTQTKWVSERLLAQAHERGIPVTIFRPASITGHSRTGAGSFANDHLWSLIKGCIQMAAAPDWSDKIDMVPVDAVSNFITEACIKTNVAGKVFNISSPSGVSWSALIAWVVAEGYAVSVVPENEWRGNYLNKVDDTNALYPLLSLYLSDSNEDVISGDNNSHSVDCENTLSVSKGLNLEFPVVDNEILHRYISFLRKVNFLDFVPGGEYLNFHATLTDNVIS